MCFVLSMSYVKLSVYHNYVWISVCHIFYFHYVICFIFSMSCVLFSVCHMFDYPYVNVLFSVCLIFEFQYVIFFIVIMSYILFSVWQSVTHCVHAWLSWWTVTLCVLVLDSISNQSEIFTFCYISPAAISQTLNNSRTSKNSSVQIIFKLVLYYHCYINPFSLISP